jgi:hypothetical protein
MSSTGGTGLFPASFPFDPHKATPAAIFKAYRSGFRDRIYDNTGILV